MSAGLGDREFEHRDGPAFNHFIALKMPGNAVRPAFLDSRFDAQYKKCSEEISTPAR